MYSVGDIRAYQTLPELPSTMTLKGKSKIEEVTQHFLKLRHDPKVNSRPDNILLKGWVTRKNFKAQENSEKYARHYDSLEQSQRCSVFSVFEGVSLYLVPLNEQTKLFCK